LLRPQTALNEQQQKLLSQQNMAVRSLEVKVRKTLRLMKVQAAAATQPTLIAAR
jgi:hypothetical protein